METLTIKLRVIEMKATVNWFTVKRLYYKTFYLCIHRHVSVALKQPIFFEKIYNMLETCFSARNANETTKRNAKTHTLTESIAHAK